jgi:hypothetical protein
MLFEHYGTRLTRGGYGRMLCASTKDTMERKHHKFLLWLTFSVARKKLLLGFTKMMKALNKACAVSSGCLVDRLDIELEPSEEMAVDTLTPELPNRQVQRMGQWWRLIGPNSM